MEDLRNKITNIYTLVMLVGLPLFMNGGYYTITETKYSFFFFVSIIYIVAASLTMIYDLFSYGLEMNSDILPIYIALGVFVAGAVITTLLSKYKVLIGSTSRYQGLIPILMYGAIILLISQSQVNFSTLINALLISSILINVLAVIHYAMFDPFGFFSRTTIEQHIRFISTIGNSDFFSAYQCLIFPILLVSFIQQDEFNILKTISYCVGCFGLMCCPSDSCCTGIAVIILALPLLIVQNKKMYERLMIAGIVLISAGFIVSIIPTSYMSNIMLKMVSDMRVTIILLLLLGAFYYLLRCDDHLLIKRYYTIALIIILVGFVGFLIVVNTQHVELGDLNQYFIFNKKWGTHRGKIWSFCWQLYVGLPFVNKVFGVGCDSLGKIANVTNTFKRLLNAAHNEYLNYLICQGFIGALSYLVMVVLSVKQGIMNRLQHPYILALTLSVTAYAIQAIFNIAQPNTTPLLFIMIGLLMSAGIHLPKTDE